MLGLTAASKSRLASHCGMLTDVVVLCVWCALQDDVAARQAKLTAMAEESKKDEAARKAKNEPAQE